MHRSMLLRRFLFLAMFLKVSSDASHSARRWISGPSSACDLKICYWPAIFSLRRCREALARCAPNGEGCAQTLPFPAAALTQLGRSIGWSEYMKPGFLIGVLSGQGQSLIVPTIAVGEEYEYRIRFGNITDVSEYLIPAALMLGITIPALHELFPQILAGPEFNLESTKHVLKRNQLAKEETVDVSIQWRFAADKGEVMDVHINQGGATHSASLHKMLSQPHIVQVAIAVGYSVGLQFGGILTLALKVVQAVCDHSKSVLRKRHPLALCVESTLQSREPFSSLWSPAHQLSSITPYKMDSQTGVVSAQLHSLLAFLVNKECSKQIWQRDQALYVAQNLLKQTPPSMPVEFPNLRAFSDHENTLLKLISRYLPPQGVLCEFGVNSGFSIRRLAQQFPARMIHGFDSFSGLPETWAMGLSQGEFDRHGVLPNVPKNVQLHPGWFNETVTRILSQAQMIAAPSGLSVAFAHIDCDLYSSTRDALIALKPWLQKGSLILFDEYFGYPEWALHEHKAWIEFVQEYQIEFRFVAHSTHRHHDEFSKLLIQIV